MRLLIGSLVLVIGLMGAYAAWPLVAAFEIRQAIHRGDVATLQRKVKWGPVRSDLKASLTALPVIVDSAAPTALSPGHGTQISRPSLWARLKSTVVTAISVRAIDKYMTAEGIGGLQARHGRFLTILGFPRAESIDTSTTQLQKFTAFYDKIVHAHFVSLSRVEFEIADRPRSQRHIVAVFELADFEWTLTSVRVVHAEL